MTLSVLIATKERPDALATCVRTVLAQAHRPDEIVIIDQSQHSHQPAIMTMCGEAGVPLRYEHAPHLSGLTAARNRAIDLASGTVLLFLDDDVELLPGYHQAIIEVFEHDPDMRVGGASGYAVNLGPALSPAQRLRSMLFYRGPFSVERDALAFHLHPGTRPRAAQRLYGSNMAYRRIVFADARFDETYSGYGFGEDRDFSVQLARRFRLMWVPQARLIHGKVPRSRLSHERFCELRVLSWMRFYQQYVPKTAASLAWYVWLNIGFAALMANAWDWPTVVGTYRGLRRLVAIMRGRQTLTDALQAGWRPGAAPQ